MKILDRKPKRQHTSMLNFLFVCKKGDETFHRRTKLSWSPVIVAILCDGCTSVCLSVCVMAARLSVCLCDGCTSACLSVSVCLCDGCTSVCVSVCVSVCQIGVSISTVHCC